MKRRTFLKSIATLIGSSAFARYFPAFAQQPPGFGQRFFIPPTTLHTTEDSATIYYRLASASDNGRLIVSQDGEDIQRISLPTDHPRQSITVTGLEPATRYTYRLEIDEQVTLPYLNFEESWQPLSFRTQPYDWPIRFVALGDSGFGENATYQLGDLMAAREPDFFIHLGDMVYHSYEYNNDLWYNWALKYYRPFGELLRQMPHYPTVGNHDREGTTLLDGWSFYYWAFPPLNDEEAFDGRRQWYSFSVNDVQFISLNTQCYYSEPGRAQQEKWLDERLADERFRTNIIFFHIPLWTSSYTHQFDGIYAQEALAPRFAAAADRIGLIMHGHSHLYEHLIRDGVHHITSGGGSLAIYETGESIDGSQTAISKMHYIVGEIDQGSIQIMAYDVNDTEIDRATWSI